MEYEIPKWDGDLRTPNVYFPLVSNTAQRKIDLLLQHFPSQAGRDRFTADTFQALMRIRGLEARHQREERKVSTCESSFFNTIRHCASPHRRVRVQLRVLLRVTSNIRLRPIFSPIRFSCFLAILWGVKNIVYFAPLLLFCQPYGCALTGIFIQANSDDAVANNNQILGCGLSVALHHICRLLLCVCVGDRK